MNVRYLEVRETVELAEKLRQLKKTNRLLAKESGVSEPTMRRLLSGKILKLKISHFQKIEEGIGVTLARFDRLDKLGELLVTLKQSANAKQSRESAWTLASYLSEAIYLEIGEVELVTLFSLGLGGVPTSIKVNVRVGTSLYSLITTCDRLPTMTLQTPRGSTYHGAAGCAPIKELLMYVKKELGNLATTL